MVNPARASALLLRGLAHWLYVGLRAVLFLPVSEPLDVDWSAFFALILLGLLMSIGWDFTEVGRAGRASLAGLPGALFSVPLVLFAGWALSGLARRTSMTLGLATVATSMALVTDLGFAASYWGADRFLAPGAVRQWGAYGQDAAIAWFALAFGIAVGRLLGLSAGRRVAALGMSVVLLALPLAVVPREDALWVARDQGQASVDARRAAVSAEDAFYRQPEVLEQQLAALKPGHKGRVELYFLGVAGDAAQDVFLKEVRYVGRLMHDRFGTEGHSIVLVNNPGTVNEAPIASTTSVRRALRRIGSLMNRDEDVLFLFMTSHGTHDHRLWLDFAPLNLKELAPASLRKMLDDAGIRRRIVVISACYSGGFVDALRGDDSLVITAAAADRTSFGCSNEADFTYFGKAYFEDAMAATDSFIDAYERAKPLIAAREQAEHYVSSDPQISIGKNIPSILRQLQQGLGAPRSRPTD